MKVLVTGSAGFIGFYLVRYLIEQGHSVIGIDNINNYYDINLKLSRLGETGIDTTQLAYGVPVQSSSIKDYSFIKMNLEDHDRLNELFRSEKFDRVCHLAAQAGVRYSISHPMEYINSNIYGFINILECCRYHPVQHLVYASSSSVYGLNESIPFKTRDNVDHPVSLYAATKKSNELMAHTYSYLYGIPVTGLRFFTVYGPWGRPDMAYYLFTKAILEGKTIDVYNNGNLSRDFTYIDDIIDGVGRVIDTVPSGDENWTGMNPDPGRSKAPYRLYNIGNSSPVNLLDFIRTIEKALGKEARKNYLPMQAGDVYTTYADVSDCMHELGFKPDTPLEEGIRRFVTWFKDYYAIE